MLQSHQAAVLHQRRRRLRWRRSEEGDISDCKCESMPSSSSNIVTLTSSSARLMMRSCSVEVVRVVDGSSSVDTVH